MQCEYVQMATLESLVLGGKAHFLCQEFLSKTYDVRFTKRMSAAQLHMHLDPKLAKGSGIAAALRWQSRWSHCPSFGGKV